MDKDREIRKSFKEYFGTRQHKWYTSMPLVPPDDPTMLFTTAGMVQFKKQLLSEAGQVTRAASIQKCIRTTDIDEVGRTSRHLTFFEMYGNFSFGDYFKEDAIKWGWDFLTSVLKLSENRLYATIYKDDDEAFEIWKKYLPDEKIIRLGEKDNFWTMGETGPCGPCSEIIYDQGAEKSCGKEDCGIGCGCDRYLEIWNLVFTQFDRQQDGSLKDLPKKNIDTGMGLERLDQVVMGVENVYETPVLKPIVELIKSGAENYNEVSGRIIADHARTVTFLIGDGISPSNEGRGYVLRRLIRRALREGRKIGWDRPALYKITSKVIDLLGEYYPEIEQRANHIASVCKMEEEAFLSTLDAAAKILDVYIDELKKNNEKILSAENAFKLFDTYGLPIDITKNILAEQDYKVDEEGFNKMLRDRSNNTQWKEQDTVHNYWENIKDLDETRFVGYENYYSTAKILRIVDGKGAIILDETPMYAESGGQVGDIGVIKGKTGEFKVEKTIKEENVIIHIGSLTGELNESEEVEVTVDFAARKDIERNHTATHLLQSAMRSLMGDHIQQNGSLVEAGRLRFDFTHSEPLNEQQLLDIEEKVNSAVIENLSVKTDIMDKDIAAEKGALAFFGEKYDKEVRTVIVSSSAGEQMSMELCGGTHLKNTGEIGLFKIVSESGVAAGVRRIEAVTGRGALHNMHEQETLIEKMAEKLKVPAKILLDKIDRLQKELKEKDKKIAGLENKMISGISERIARIKPLDLDTGTLHMHKFDDNNIKLMRSWADNTMGQMPDPDKPGVAALAVGKSDGKVTLILKLNKQFAEKYNAKEIMSEAAKEINGSGGGRQDMAQGGGTDAAGIQKAIDKIEQLLKRS